jgi:cytochrome c peroxidase
VGRGGKYNTEIYKGAFKTPSLRNVALTAPYMHNGGFSTLEEVIEFYNQGGGAGIGLSVPNQTLPSEKLNLTEEEKRALVAFLHTLNDTTGTNEMPQHLPSFPDEMGLNGRRVGGEY